ncbi:MAG: DUF2950 domain-containing protein [Bryobacteraceae bacterium]
MRTFTLAVIVLAGACVSIQAAPQTSQRTFATPQEAAHALAEAAEANDTAALLKILGPDGKDIVSSGDANEDKAGRAEFARLAAEKLQIRQDDADRNTILAGSQEWPFPVPLVRKNGMWVFDSAAGRVEVLARRIGRHELNAMQVCRGYVEAQMDYATHHYYGSGPMQYAQKIVSTPGKKDGLYWEGESDVLVPKSFAAAAAAMFAEGKKPVPYHGYYFHILKAQGPDADGGAVDYVVKGEMIGGFALVAFPAEYGVSGILTFIVNQHGIVYSKDLGPNTMTLARRMTVFNPDKTWKPAHLE